MLYLPVTFDMFLYYTLYTNFPYANLHSENYYRLERVLTLTLYKNLVDSNSEKFQEHTTSN